jgi:hypothetical protein
MNASWTYYPDGDPMNMASAAENTARILGCPERHCEQSTLCSERCKKNGLRACDGQGPKTSAFTTLTSTDRSPTERKG